MDYAELAAELMQSMFSLQKMRPQKKMMESMQGELFMLQYISHHEGEVLPGKISNDMEVSSARVAAVLNSLENKGLITRQIDTNDRRRILVRLTPKGKCLTKEQKKDIMDDMTKMLRYLGEDDAREYVRIMGKLAKFAPTCNKQQ